MYQNPDRISRNTSAQFDGIIALTNPGDSWVGRWQRVGEPCLPNLPPASNFNLLPRGLCERAVCCPCDGANIPGVTSGVGCKGDNVSTARHDARYLRGAIDGVPAFRRTFLYGFHTYKVLIL